jgi:hypothetical protein
MPHAVLWGPTAAKDRGFDRGFPLGAKSQGDDQGFDEIQT